MNHCPASLAAALLAAFASPALFAQAPAAETALPEVTIQGSGEPAYSPAEAGAATKIDVPLRDVPQTVNVITRELMRDRGVQSMEDAVKSVPGINLSHGDGQRDQVVIRGFSALGDQFVDGFRDDAMYYRDLSNVERIEVVKGPASVLYGRGSSGGMINRVTKKPGIDKSEVGLQLGSWNQRRGEFDIARNVSQNVAVRVTGAIERADSFRDQQFLEREAFAPSALVKFSPDNSLLLQAEYLRDKRVTDWGIPSWQGRPIDVAPGTYYGAANARQADTAGSTVSAASATLEHRFNSAWSLRNALRYYDYQLDRYITSAGAVTADANLALYPSGLRVARSRSAIARSEHGVFNQTELTQRAALGGMAHQILYGVELGVQDRWQSSRSGSAGPVDAYRPAAPDANPVLTVNSGSPNTGSSTVAAAYVQDLVSLSAQWKALLGIRYDRFRQEVDVAAIPNRTDTAWSPRAGLVWQPSASQSYYVSVSKSFQPAGENFNLSAGNATTEPQETTSKEIGAKIDLLDGRATATAALFNLERTNIMTSAPANPAFSVPVGTQRTHGLELTFAGDLPGGWRASAGYAYMDAKVSRSLNPALQGRRATLTPEHGASLWLTKALARGWQAGAGMNYVGARFADPANTTTLPAYATVDAMLAYRMGKVDLQLNLYNLFDRRYIASAHGSVANSLLPGAPRSVRLTTRYAF
ncbi:MAG: TonB-dependent receptor [Comamonadaceae bacterium SCN 68-20]|nr:MAG: TonB-dependent receptor [Comamonadaceae bacterium SCN 68-20]OJX21534.1 MAG: TonB-dependent receptor [Burkholderiales bacterium 68-20]